VCAPGCYPGYLGDGECDSECFHRFCSFDNGDCS
jgi:hypothetical protein